MLYFLIIFTLILYAGHFYVGKRLLSTSSFSDKTRTVAWSIILVVPLFVPASFLLRFSNFTGLLTDLIGWIAFLGMGFFSILLAFVFTKDLVLLSLKIIPKTKSSQSFDPSKRAFLMNSVNYSIIGGSVLLTGYGIYEARREPDLQEITVHLPNLPKQFEGYRIAQFTDLHVGPTIKRGFVESVVSQINGLLPDMIVFTGDLVDGTVPALKEDVAPLRDLSAPDGTFFVTGNHEYYSGAFAWIDEVTRLGMQVLIEAHKSH